MLQPQTHSRDRAFALKVSLKHSFSPLTGEASDPAGLQHLPMTSDLPAVSRTCPDPVLPVCQLGFPHGLTGSVSPLQTLRYSCDQASEEAAANRRGGRGLSFQNKSISLPTSYSDCFVHVILNLACWVATHVISSPPF